MTQFMLCDPLRTSVMDAVDFRPIEDEPWLAAAAQALFPDPDLVRVPVLADGASVDELFTEAHNAVFNGGDFGSTRLSRILPQLASRCGSLAIWWADDWSDLPVQRTTDALMRAVIDQLREPVGDVYVYWENPRTD
jgi:hypothetical protein